MTSKNYHSLGIRPVNKYGKNLSIKEEGDLIELDLGPTQDILKEDYLDVYEGIQPEILNTARFDENSDLSTIYLGNQTDPKMTKLKQMNPFPYQNKGTC